MYFLDDAIRTRERYCGASERFFECDFVTERGLGGTQFNAVPSFGRIMACLARGGALLLRGQLRVMGVLLLRPSLGSVSAMCAIALVRPNMRAACDIGV